MEYQFEQILRNEFEVLRQEIIDAYDSKGMRATGKFEKESIVESSNSHVAIKAPKYAEQLEYGRSPGPVSREGVQSITEWILAKNVFNEAIAKIGLSSLSFLIARKIAREGFNRENYGGVDLVSEVVTPQRIQNIINKVGENAVVTFVSELKLKEWQ